MTTIKYIILSLLIILLSGFIQPLSALEYVVEHPCDGMLGKIELTCLENYEIAEVNWYTVDVVTNDEALIFDFDNDFFACRR